MCRCRPCDVNETVELRFLRIFRLFRSLLKVRSLPQLLGPAHEPEGRVQFPVAFMHATDCGV